MASTNWSWESIIDRFQAPVSVGAPQNGGENRERVVTGERKTAVRWTEEELDTSHFEF
jgi:hypothetical protein